VTAEIFCEPVEAAVLLDAITGQKKPVAAAR
jgi:hypothetical protein